MSYWKKNRLKEALFIYCVTTYSFTKFEVLQARERNKTMRLEWVDEMPLKKFDEEYKTKKKNMKIKQKKVLYNDPLPPCTFIRLFASYSNCFTLFFFYGRVIIYKVLICKFGHVWKCICRHDVRNLDFRE